MAGDGAEAMVEYLAEAPEEAVYTEEPEEAPEEADEVAGCDSLADVRTMEDRT